MVLNKLLIFLLVLCVCDVFAVGRPQQDTDIDTHSNARLLPDSCGETHEVRPLSGNRASVYSLYEFPWLALISYAVKPDGHHKKYKFKCSGTVISSRYILTAAQCVAGKSIAGVRVGDFNFSTKMDCLGVHPDTICDNRVQDIRVEKAIVHEDYTRIPQMLNDIALLRLKDPLDFSYKNSKPICLPMYKGLRNITLGGKMATLAGWGVTDAGGLSPELQKDYVQIKPDAECRESYAINSEPFTMDDKFCAGRQVQNFCWAIGGSPLMLEDEYNGRNRMIQYGITSFGPAKCGSAVPDMYTDVRKFVKWILDNIEE